jgi:adenylate cyclase class 2
VYEVELKVRAEHEPVRAALDRLGAESLGVVEQIDTYYDAPHRDFAETDEALRLRRERDGAADSDEADSTAGVVTYKGPLVDERSKTRREIESGVVDADAMDDVLGAVGFSAAATVEKRRERYRVEDATVTLDTVSDLGQFVEVETEVVPGGESTRQDEAAIAASRAELQSILEELGLDPADGIRTSYLGLLLEDDAS